MVDMSSVLSRVTGIERHREFSAEAVVTMLDGTVNCQNCQGQQPWSTTIFFIAITIVERQCHEKVAGLFNIG